MADASQSAFTLGSASPRRSGLLASIGLSFDIETADIDEAALVAPDESDPYVIVERISRAKFDAFPTGIGHPLLLTADTMVACTGAVLGKPDSAQHLAVMLRQMSGRDLTIATAVCVGQRGKPPAVEISSTLVVLRELDQSEIDRYITTGVGMDKAGGLALQAQAKPFIHSVSGCWSNVLGLPLCVASRLLRDQRDSANGTDLSIRCSVDLCGRYDR